LDTARPVQIAPLPTPVNFVLAMMLAHTNPVVFKTTLKEGRGEDRYLCSSVRGLIKNTESENTGVFSICLK